MKDRSNCLIIDELPIYETPLILNVCIFLPTNISDSGFYSKIVCSKPHKLLVFQDLKLICFFKEDSTRY